MPYLSGMKHRNLAFFALGIVVVACSASNGKNEFQPGGDGGAGAGAAVTTTGTMGLGGDLTTSSGTSTGSSSGCTMQAELVYVLSAENDLYSFEPDKKLFTKIGPLQCNTSLSPNSMAVDRNAVAWVNYVADDGLGTDTAGSVFKVSTTDASCQPTQISLPVT